MRRPQWRAVSRKNKMEIIKEYIGPIIFFGIYFLIYVVQKLPKPGGEEGASPSSGESRSDSDFEAARRMVEEKRRQAQRQSRQGGYASRSGEGEYHGAKPKPDGYNAASTFEKHWNIPKPPDALPEKTASAPAAATTPPYAGAEEEIARLLREAQESGIAGGLGNSDAYAVKDAENEKEVYRIKSHDEISENLRRDKKLLRQAVIFSEIIGRPAALKDPDERFKF